MKKPGPSLFKSKIYPYSWLIVLVFAALPYIWSLDGEFVFDDGPLIADDPFYENEDNPFLCWNRSFWKESRRQGLYRPVTVFSYWLNARLTGVESFWYRAVNLLLHISVSLLVLRLGLKLGTGRLVALGAALVFAVHPIHSEAVIPAFGRAELLCALFLLLCLIFHIKRDRYSPLIAALFGLLACWSKEHGVVFIPACFLIDAYRNLALPGKSGSFAGHVFYKYLVYLSCLALAVAARYAVLGTVIPAKDRFQPVIDNRLALVPQGLMQAGAVMLQGKALKLFVWPRVLSHDYSYAQIIPPESCFELSVLLPILLVILVSALFCVFFPAARKKWLLLIALYAVCVLPASNLIVPAGTVFAERLQYIPSVWLCFLAVIAIRRLCGKAPVIFMLTILLLSSLLAARTIVRGGDWDSRLSIALAGTRTAPRSVKTWNNLAVQYEALAEERLAKAGPAEAVEYYKLAVLACSKALAIYPDYNTAYINRGTFLAKLGRYEDSEKDFLKALSLSPGNLRARMNYGVLLVNTGRLEQAEKVWRRSLESFPDQPVLRSYYRNLVSEIKNAGQNSIGD